MRLKSTTKYLWILLFITACGSDEPTEIQNVEVTQAPLKMDLVLEHPAKMNGRTLKAYHDDAPNKRPGAFEKADASSIILTLEEPTIVELPELPTLSTKESGLESPQPVRPDPDVVNAGFPDYQTTLPPRYKDAASFDFQYLDVTQGLNSSYIWDIEQDEDGYLWFGTFGGGIARYDGQNLIRYTENQGLPSSFVWGIEEALDGNLWVGTYGSGVSMFDGKTFTNYTAEDGLGSDYTFCIHEDIEGHLWIGTDGAGVVKFDGTRFTRMDEDHGVLSNRVIDILQDDHRNFWFACYEGGVCMYNGRSFTYLTEEVGLPSNNVQCIEQDDRGYIWIGTEDAGVAMYDGKSLTVYNSDIGLPTDNIFDIAQGEDGNVWMTTEGGGVLAFDGKSFHQFTEEEGLSTDFTRSCFSDKDGNMWFGTDGGGVNRFHPGSFRHFTERDGLSSNFVWSIMEDSQGNIWFGTDGNGACKFDGKNYTYLTEENGLGSNIVLDIVEDWNGNIWMATDYSGLSIYDGETITNIGTDEGLPSLSILDLQLDSDGNMWMATQDSGICKYDGTHYTYYTSENGLLSDETIQIIEDQGGDIWIAYLDKGISEFNGKYIRHFNEEAGLSSDLVQAIYEDKGGNIWVGHNGSGLDKIENNESVTRFTTEDGLTSNYIYSIIEDDDQRLWVCTETGISCLDIDSNRTSSFPHIYAFSKQDGLKSLVFYTTSALHDSNNRLWWGSSQALTMLDLENVASLKPAKPKINLTNVTISENNVDYSKLSLSDSLGYTYNSVNQHENVPVGLELDYEMNHLTLHFAGIDWNAPQGIRYSYLMEGIDKQWSVPSSENKADYRNLPIGTHTFQVKAVSSSGVWSDPEKFTFRVFPPWYETWWAIGLYIVLLIALFYIGYKLRTIKYRQRQAVLEKTVQRRTKEIWAQKQEIENQQKEVLEAYEQLEEKNKEVLSSINYAKRIQNAILPADEWMKQNFPDSFVLYMPKDIVAGDFYWCEKVGSKIFVAAADCTGHGVPGAMVSVICHNALNKALHEFGLTSAAAILDQAREDVVDKFEQSAEGIKDGMDISLAVVDTDTKTISWAGANNPIWIIRKGDTDIQEIRADKQPIGKYPSSKPFTDHQISYKSGDTIYMFTDGYADQFGGPKGKKFKLENLKQFLLGVQELDMELQPYKLKQTFAHWKGDYEQIDDVCVIGIKL